MKDGEIEDARSNGVEPVEYVVAIDALAIIVHPDNPVSELSIGQLSDIFTGRISNWREVGGNDASIILVSRESNSGTHVYFLEEVVRHSMDGVLMLIIADTAQIYGTECAFKSNKVNRVLINKMLDSLSDISLGFDIPVNVLYMDDQGIRGLPV